MFSPRKYVTQGKKLLTHISGSGIGSISDCKEIFGKYIILSVVLYGCETWSLILREKCRLWVLENKISRRIFGSKRDENGEWRNLYNENLHSLYRSPNIVRAIKSRRLRWAGHVARMEERKSGFKILTGKPTGLGLGQH